MSKKSLLVVSMLVLALTFTACSKKEANPKNTTSAETTTTTEAKVEPSAEFDFTTDQVVDVLKTSLKNQKASIIEPETRTEKNYEITSTGFIISEKETRILLYTNLNSNKVTAVQYILPAGLITANTESIKALATTINPLFTLAGLKDISETRLRNYLTSLDKGNIETLDTIKGQIVGDNMQPQFVFLPANSNLVPKELSKNKK